VLQCTSKYPCPPEDAGLNVILELKKRYDFSVGYSDHTQGLAIPLAAVVLGAEVVEKHFTLSKKMYGSDARFATEPDEFKRLVEEIRALEKALQNKVDKNKKAEELKEMKIVFEKSIVTACAIKAGTVIEDKHLAYKKPGDGIPARKFKEVIGKVAKKDMPANYKIKWEDLTND
jgi:sialic acid synthase SpsE